MAAREEPGQSCYYFDDVVVDLAGFRLLKAGDSRTLEPRVFDLLIFLIDEELVNDATDLRRGIDYLQTRDDIDGSRIAYFGFSQGAS